MFICANYQRSFTLRYKSKRFSTLTHKSNTAFLLFFSLFKWLQPFWPPHICRLGLFLVCLQCCRLYESCSQVSVKEKNAFVLLETGSCPLVAKQHYGNILKDRCVVSTVTIYNTKGRTSRLRILQHSASEVYHLFSEAEWWSSCFDSRWGTTPSGSWRGSSWFQAWAASSTQPLARQKLLPVP